MKNKAKISTLALALLAMTITGCNRNTPEEPEDVEVVDNITKITLDRMYASMFCSDKQGNTFNEELQLNATALPKKAGARKIVWSSSNEGVAKVDQTGKVTAVGEGTAEVTASNAEGTVSASTHIVVNNMNEVKLAQCTSRLNDIMTTQNKDSFQMPRVVTTIENFEKSVTKNGVLQTKEWFTQGITVSEEDAYIKLDVDSNEIRCEGGSPTNSTSQYVFYTTDQYESYLFKSSGNTKNYMSANQANFIGKGKLEALKAVCDNFFVAGSSILTENFEGILNQKVASGALVSAKTNPHYGRMADVPGQLAFDLVASYDDQIADSEDEDDLNIPAGTKYLLDISDRFLFENFLCTGKYIEEKYTYKIGDDEYVVSYTVDYFYRANDELTYPTKAEYSKVDDIFSL